ncbi:hypothetical protein [Arsenicicoccus sp. oral taxon 190]|uniref:hypothetical protein n=1 Tax=Arsenicicoccus sp. oral taxon 190 TaxID=1658671 RepID=UPI00067A351A|nr:hypothetical protein [Arsenicicoccus sp. oral taxon 190]AKT51942.1 hypothetical protein ADJ73_12835 [Arsenicicoccus sp. oral taxon 190]
MSDQQPRPGDVPSYPSRPQSGGGAYDDPYAAEQQRSGGRLFPFPSWTTRTRSGSTVTVGGCCLPLPIGCLATTLTVGAIAATRVVRHVRR